METLDIGTILFYLTDTLACRQLVEAKPMNDGSEYLITVDLSSNVPIYRQIADSIIGDIASGKLVEGDRLLSSRRLSSLLGVNYHTVNKAYELLSRDGFIQQDRRKKIFVSKLPSSQNEELDPEWIRRQRLLISEAISRGFPRSRIMRGIESILESMPEGREKQ